MGRILVTGADGFIGSHLAALIGSPYSYHAPDSYIQTNIVGTFNIVQGVRDLGLKKAVISSTSETYGTARFVPITENHPMVGQSPYAATKIGADPLALSYFRSFDTPIAVARPFNTYCPRQFLRAVIPTIITQIGNTVKMIAEVMNTEIEIETDDQRLRPQKSEVERLFAENSKALRLLDGCYEYGDLEGLRKGLKITADWFSDNKNRAFYKIGHYSI